MKQISPKWLSFFLAFSDKHVTPLGGMSLMKSFIEQAGIGDFLGNLDLPQTGSNRDYVPELIIESFWLHTI